MKKFFRLLTVRLLAVIILFFSFHNLLSGCQQEQGLVPINLTIDHLSEPLGLDNPHPHVSWQTDTGNSELWQTAYQIIVATSPGKLTEQDADQWNSGKVVSDQSLYIPYRGKSLQSGTRYYWKVRLWNQDGKPETFSNSSWWEMGLLEDSEWKAQWISAVGIVDSVPPVLPAPYFRKEFSLPANIQSARLYISGLGYYETYMNGIKVGDHVLDPVKTHYDRRVKYVSYDVDDFLKEGSNTIGVVLGNGWYNQHTREAWNFDMAPWRDAPKMICQLLLTDINGNQTMIASDDSWKFSTGPIVFDGIHNGETYDARLELGSWNQSGYDDLDWKPAIIVPGPGGVFSSQVMPPIRIINSVSPMNTWQINDSTTMIDLGQNITGWAQIRVRGPEGSRVSLRYGERIFDDGTLDQVELSRFIWTGETQTGRYYLKGQGEETWHPVFTYHGFQYIEVTCSDPDIEMLDIQGHVVHSDIQEKGYFLCSSELFNKINDNLKWSFLGNYHGYPTDCPHREKMGWTGDALLVVEAGLFNFDMTRAYLKWIDDFIDEQRPNGQLPGIIPTSGWGYTHGGNPETRPRGYGPQWEGAFLEIPWQMFLALGDTSIIENYYEGFKRYVDYLTDNARGYLLNFGIDDHKQLKPLTSGDYLSSAFFFRFTGMLSRMAAITGNDADHEKYGILSGNIKNAFNEKYFNREQGTYLHGGQTPMALALYFGLVNEHEQARILNNLLSVIAENDGHIDAGVVGTKAVINTLLMFGEERVLFDMADKRNFPSWGYWIEELGATTLFQNWDGSQSRNHIMFGSIGDYFYKGLAGLNIDDKNPGYKHFIIRPSVNNDIQWVEAGHHSPYGMIRSHWKKDPSGITMDVTVPSRTTASIFVPAPQHGKVSFQRGKIAEYVGYMNGYHVYKAASGDYTIRVH